MCSLGRFKTEARFLCTPYASLPWFCVQLDFYAYYTQKLPLTRPLRTSNASMNSQTAAAAAPKCRQLTTAARFETPPSLPRDGARGAQIWRTPLGSAARGADMRARLEWVLQKFPKIKTNAIFTIENIAKCQFRTITDRCKPWRFELAGARDKPTFQERCARDYRRWTTRSGDVPGPGSREEMWNACEFLVWFAVTFKQWWWSRWWWWLCWWGWWWRLRRCYSHSTIVVAIVLVTVKVIMVIGMVVVLVVMRTMVVVLVMLALSLVVTVFVVERVMVVVVVVLLVVRVLVVVVAVVSIMILSKVVLCCWWF